MGGCSSQRELGRASAQQKKPEEREAGAHGLTPTGVCYTQHSTFLCLKSLWRTDLLCLGDQDIWPESAPVLAPFRGACLSLVARQEKRATRQTSRGRGKGGVEKCRPSRGCSPEQSRGLSVYRSEPIRRQARPGEVKATRFMVSLPSSPPFTHPPVPPISSPPLPPYEAMGRQVGFWM